MPSVIVLDLEPFFTGEAKLFLIEFINLPDPLSHVAKKSR